MHINNMPTILLLSNLIKVNINPRDKHKFPHVHVVHAEKAALISLESFEIIENTGFSHKPLKKVISILKDEKSLVMEAWRNLNE